MIELTAFIIMSVIITIVTIADAWHDKLVIYEITKLRIFISSIGYTSPNRKNTWKLWENAIALGWITFFTIMSGLFFSSWTVAWWIPIFYLVWWTMHDIFTGKFIMDDWWHVSSDPITQFFARMCQQSGEFLFLAKAFILVIAVLSYLSIII